MVYHGRNIPNTYIIDLLDYTLLPYEAQIPDEHLLTKLAKEEHRIPNRRVMMRATLVVENVKMVEIKKRVLTRVYSLTAMTR